MTPPRRGERRDVPNATEMYGFVSWILSAVCYLCYLLWAYIPDGWLDALGILYRPSKYWAVAIPAWLCSTLSAYWMGAIALSLVNTQALDSEFAVSDNQSKPEVTSLQQAQHPAMIPAIGDIPISTINQVLYPEAYGQENDYFKDSREANKLE